MNKIGLRVGGKKIEVDFNEHFRALAKVNEAMTSGVLEHYRKCGLTYVDVPAIVGITGACENIDTLFRVGSRTEVPLFFAQTGQLSLEQALQTLPGVCTIIHSGRDEEKEDSRHLRQFRLIEEEFDCTLAGMARESYDEDRMYEALLEHIQNAIRAMVASALQAESNTLARYGRNVKKLEQALSKPFLRIEYEEAIALLKDNGFPNLKFGDDLESNEEAKVVALLNAAGEELPVFIMKYPKEIKFFNMKTSSKDSRVALSADLILPYSGEGVGSAVREHEFERLDERLKASTMFKLHLERGGTYEDFAWYLNIMKAQKTNPHAGYGIGNDRVMQYAFATPDIRAVSLFALLNTQTGDWQKKPAVAAN
ncbi:MAG: hypothetical protein HZB70_02735 [Candidatus Berkelbacteria bacterium]|nr:MAG: hypothetical protein HZB70_02735 [Candidatus Berkelbacteria bacterium]QQG51777.1 MAG: hypothetical protein HY845_00260 [Candidatus Berkelbacteria bacterium]